MVTHHQRTLTGSAARAASGIEWSPFAWQITLKTASPMAFYFANCRELAQL
jgi:hypothetical protein